MLPPDWRAGMVEMIRGAVPASGEWFTGNDRLTPEEQISIYQEQYRLRMWDAITEDIPGLMLLLGEDADEVLWAYLDEHPPDSWTLARIADRLPDWLERRGAPAEQVDMARLDRLVLQGFVAADGLVPTAADLAGGERVRLSLQPYVGLLRARFNVHHLRSASLAGEPAPELRLGDYCIGIFRIDRQMRHIELEPGAYAILEAIGRGDGLEMAVEAAVREVGSVEQVVPKISGWFQRFVERRLLQVG